jgi:hypothetical protein
MVKFQISNLKLFLPLRPRRPQQLPHFFQEPFVPVHRPEALGQNEIRKLRFAPDRLPDLMRDQRRPIVLPDLAGWICLVERLPVADLR